MPCHAPRVWARPRSRKSLGDAASARACFCVRANGQRPPVRAPTAFRQLVPRCRSLLLAAAASERSKSAAEKVSPCHSSIAQGTLHTHPTEKMSNPVCFFDMTIGGQPAGRIEMTLRADVTPKTAGA